MTPLVPFRRRFLLLAPAGLLLASCASVTSQPKARPRLVQSLFVSAAPALYRDEKTGSTAGTFLVQDFMQLLASQISRRLNEAGNDTSTSTAPGPAGSVQALVRQRQRTTGITEALVITVQRVRMAGAFPTSIDLQANLYDATSLDVLWDYSFTGKVDGRAIPEITQSVIGALRRDGFVR